MTQNLSGDSLIEKSSCSEFVLGVTADGGMISLAAVSSIVKEKIEVLQAAYQSVFDILGFKIRCIYSFLPVSY